MDWLEILLITLAGSFTLVGYLRQLPVHSVLMVFSLCAALSWIGTALGIQLHWLAVHQGRGGLLLGQVPILYLALLTVGLLSSRATAKLLLRSWRLTYYYGYFLAMISMILALILYSLWLNVERPGQQPRLLPQPLHVEAIILGFLFVALIYLVLVPWTINKRPVPAPDDWLSFWAWIILVLGGIHAIF